MLLCSLLKLGRQQSVILWVAVIGMLTAAQADELKFEADQPIQLQGQTARHQLLVTSHVNGRVADVTRMARFSIQPTELAQVRDGGILEPLTDGEGTVIAQHNGMTARISFRVSGAAAPAAIDFQNQIVPIFTKLGCNGGGCHGKSGGQNGFRLSLLGFYPNDDYEYLKKEARGRRVFPAIPEKSLLLTKATGKVPHGGGKRMESGSYEHRLIADWIRHGMTFGAKDKAKLVEIKCVPEARILLSGTEQQIRVMAYFDDGSASDVTAMSLFEVNDSEMADVDQRGFVSAKDLVGEVAVMARYQDQAATFRATIPLGADTERMPVPFNFIDEAVFGKLQLLGIPASDVCDDATFLRRVSLDIAGVTADERQVAEFLADESADKRNRLIDTLLNRPEYADHFANKWNLILRNQKSRPEDAIANQLFRDWIRDSIYDNQSYDQFVTELLTATGESLTNPAVTWYREVDQIEEQVEDTAQLFLGVRLQCAKCHHHPFERWSQSDYFGMAAFFSRVGKRNVAGLPKEYRDRVVYHKEGTASARNPRTGQTLRPTGLGGPALQVPANADPRRYLAEWMTSPQNPLFARSLVNRYWKHFFSRGIVEPEDDMRATNPPTNPELLDRLAQHFVDSGYDLKDLIRTICRSKTYQLSSLPNEYNQSDKQNFSRYYPRRLPAESLHEAFHRLTLAQRNLAGLPAGATATQLADSATGPYFLKVFGMPSGDTACECERSGTANLAQSLHLLNSKEVQQKISFDQGRAAQLAKDSVRTHEEKITEVYLLAFGRSPDEAELRVAIDHINAHDADVRRAYEDLLWAVVNTKEFLFNH